MDDKKQIRNALISAFWITVIPWLVEIIQTLFSLDLSRYGLYPLEWKGLWGILSMPLLHDNWMHLLSNTPPLFLLTFGLFVFYNKKGWEILFYLYLVSGLLTWLMGRSFSVHIGASGLIYAQAAFHFVSGMIKKVPRQMAFALLVAFLYGGFIWAFFPSLYKDTSISWEGHLSGLLTGITFAIYFRHAGPKPPPSPFPEQEDENEEEDENAYWKIPEEEERKNPIDENEK